MADAIVEHGAPCVRELGYVGPTVMHCLPYLHGLEELTLVPSVDEPYALEAALGGGGGTAQPCLPRLRQLHLYIDKAFEEEKLLMWDRSPLIGWDQMARRFTAASATDGYLRGPSVPCIFCVCR